EDGTTQKRTPTEADLDAGVTEPELDANGRLIIQEDGTTLKRTPTKADLDERSIAGVTGGDMKRKGKLEPYAYWPLDRKV
nr:hypothetical protein [Tanacetum cinerariifolium]